MTFVVLRIQNIHCFGNMYFRQSKHFQSIDTYMTINSIPSCSSALPTMVLTPALAEKLVNKIILRFALTILKKRRNIPVTKTVSQSRAEIIPLTPNFLNSPWQQKWHQSNHLRHHLLVDQLIG